MRLTIIGCSPAIQNPEGACSSYLISHAGGQLLVDCGHGAVGILRGVTDLRHLSAVVISHMHPDHIFDLVPLSYGFLFGRLPRVPLALPPGGLNALRALQRAVNLSDTHFEDIFAVCTYDPEEPLGLAGLEIGFARTQHFIPAYAMRFSPPGATSSLAYSADTAWSETVVSLLDGASLAIVEASVPEYREDEDEADHGHLTPELAGKLARAAGVGRLIVTHFGEINAEATMREASAAFGGETYLARERHVYEVGGQGTRTTDAATLPR